MLDLTIRQKDILKDILDNEIIDIEDIAKRNNVSVRTIYRDIEKITEELSYLNLQLNKEKDKYIIEGSQDNLLELKHIIANTYYELTPLERKKIILKELLTSKEPIKLEYFAKVFDLTPPTISYYLKDIEKWLEKNNILLISKPGVGIKIEGSEENIRKATANFIYENMDLNSLMEYMHIDNVNGFMPKESKVFDLLDIEIVSQIEKSIIKLQQIYNYPILDKVYINLTIHIALAIKRIKKGEEIKLDPNTLKELKKRKEFEMANTLTQFLKETTGIELPEDEVGYITMHLLGLDYKSTLDAEYKTYANEMVNIIIKEANKKFHVDFSKDNLLIDGLTNHLMYTITRIKSNLNIRNPMLKEIKEKYSLLFNKTQEIMNVVIQKYNIDIPEDEIGYIAIHLGAAIERIGDKENLYNVVVVCSSGIGSSQMLLSKLNKFPQLNILGCCSLEELKYTLNKNHVDLVISTVPICDNLGVKKVIVTPLLLDEDIKKIEESLNIKNLYIPETKKSQNPILKRKKQIKNIAIYGSNIVDILKNTHMIIHREQNIENIIDELLKVHLENKKIDKTGKDKILEKLIDRNTLAPIILPNKKFVLYHIATNYVDEILITIGKFKNPITMKNILGKKELVHTSFLLVAPKDKKSIETLGDLSAALIEDDKLVEELNNSTDEKQVVEALEDALLLNYYKEIRRIYDEWA